MAVCAFTYFKITILPKLTDYFESCVLDEKKSSSKEIVLRADICTADQIDYFKEVFSKLTNTEWIVYRSTLCSQRFSVSKKWICQHSKRFKTLKSKRNIDCKAKLQVIVKNITKSTLKSDIYLRRKPALRGEIKIATEHTHDTTCAEALKMLRVNNEVKECFFEYFSNGMSAAEARKHHENIFLLDGDFESLANAAVNPTVNQIKNLHLRWRELNLGSALNPFEKLEKIPVYEANETTVHIKEEDS